MQGAAYWAWRLSSALAQRLPAGLTYAVAVAGGDLAYLAWAPKREIARRNLARVLGLTPEHPAVAAAARRSFRNFARYLVEIMRFPALTTSDTHAFERRFILHASPSRPHSIGRPSPVKPERGEQR